MLLKPAVIALVASSALVLGLVAYAARDAVRILRRWDLASGSSLQLALERRTYLVSTVLAYVLALELASAFLFVYAADALAPQLTGAMCAAGSLKANAFGYPALLAKLLAFFGAGLWLLVNHADARGHDYPLIRLKYGLLLALAPLVAAEAGLQAAYFAGLRPDVITSCCGSAFAAGGRGLGADLAGLPARPAAAALYLAGGAVVLLGLAVRLRGRGAAALAVAGLAALPVGVAAVVAFVSPYVYELPTHHCPFCLLQREYHHVGYLLYAALLGGSLAALGAGVMRRYRRVPSLADALPPVERRLGGVAALLWGAFLAAVTWSVLASQLTAS